MKSRLMLSFIPIRRCILCMEEKDVKEFAPQDLSTTAPSDVCLRCWQRGGITEESEPYEEIDEEEIESAKHDVYLPPEMELNFDGV